MQSDKYVVHYGSLAGMSYKLAEACNEAGCKSKNIILCDRDVDDLKRSLPYHQAVFLPSDSPAAKVTKVVKNFYNVANEASLIHYYSSTLLFREAHFLFEGPLLRMKGVPSVITFGGSDIRVPSIAKANNKYFEYFYKQNDWLWEKRVKERVWSLSKFVDAAAVDPEMLDYMGNSFRKVYPFRQPVDIDVFDTTVKQQNPRPVILHIPTSPKLKGTDYVIAAAERLKQDGYDFDFVLKRQLTQLQVYEELSKADIYVDELRCGAHGVTSVEAMAAGCATLTYIRDDLLLKYPSDLPIVSANPDTIYTSLKALLESRSRVNDLGSQGVEYAKKYHCSKRVAQDLIGIYQDLWSDSGC